MKIERKRNWQPRLSTCTFRSCEHLKPQIFQRTVGTKSKEANSCTPEVKMRTNFRKRKRRSLREQYKKKGNQIDDAYWEGIIYPNQSQDIQGSLAVNGMFQGFFLTENFCQSENVWKCQTAPSFWICFLNHNFHVYKQYVILFECGKCEVRNNKIIDLNGHLRFIHSDKFQQPSATILIEIQRTVNKIHMIPHNYSQGDTPDFFSKK